MDSTYQQLDQRLVARYLDLLHVSKQQPSLDALRELVVAHMTRVPFENISKLFYYKHLGLNNIPDIQTYLNGIEQYHFGGTCYSNNYHLYLLLLNLGYTVKLCGADMNSPDAHLAIMATVEEREYLFDATFVWSARYYSCHDRLGTL